MTEKVLELKCPCCGEWRTMIVEQELLKHLSTNKYKTDKIQRHGYHNVEKFYED